MFLGACFFLSCIHAAAAAGLQLNDFISHFEPLFYDVNELKWQQLRNKRDASGTIRLQFVAHQKLFRLLLQRDNSIFTRDAVIENQKGIVSFQFTSVRGKLEDEEDSSVRGLILQDWLFDGTIATRNGIYHVEPSSRYFSRDPGFHSVIYRSEHISGPWKNLPWDPHDLLLPVDPPPSLKEASRRQRRLAVAASLPRDSRQRRFAHRRRSSEKNARDKTTCMLYLQADHLFYERMGSEEACIESMTRHVQRINDIYRTTDFDRDGKEDHITFMIKRIKVYTTEALSNSSYRFPGNYGVEKFLELFSEEDYDDFCLAYMFTFRDFEGGTLGLAWTGDMKNAGGVCEKNGHYRGSLKSLNTGIVTMVNYGKPVPPAVSHVTLAHEIGHNFGSPHDPEHNRRCVPGGEDGNYIMFARATAGDKKNNNKFSPCSLEAIGVVLESKARSSTGCFSESQLSICGNGVVEEDEECDCGWEEDCKEDCCYPMKKSPGPKEFPCRLKARKACSPSQGPCCTSECRLTVGTLCREDNGCREASRCDGTSPFCPPSANKPNRTICQKDFVCFRGECTGSFCLAYGLESCQCKTALGDPPTKACELCCKLPGENQECRSSFEWNSHPFDVPDMYSKPGTPCNDYNGYCDVFQRCREVDPSGPLATLRRFFLSDGNFATLGEWMRNHWHAVLAVVVFLIFFGFLSSKLARAKRRRNPSRKTIYHAQDPRTYEAPVGRKHTVHPTAVRVRVPLKSATLRGMKGKFAKTLEAVRSSTFREKRERKQSSREKDNRLSGGPCSAVQDPSGDRKNFVHPTTEVSRLRNRQTAGKKKRHLRRARRGIYESGKQQAKESGKVAITEKDALRKKLLSTAPWGFLKSRKEPRSVLKKRKFLRSYSDSSRDVGKEAGATAGRPPPSTRRTFLTLPRKGLQKDQCTQ